MNSVVPTIIMRAIGVSHTACKDEFRRNLRSHSWMESIFIFYNNLCALLIHLLVVQVSGTYLIARNRNPGWGCDFWYWGEGVICTNFSSRIHCLPRSISLPFLRPVLTVRVMCRRPSDEKPRFCFSSGWNSYFSEDDVPETNFSIKFTKFLFLRKSVVWAPFLWEGGMYVRFFLICITMFQNASNLFSRFALLFISLRKCPYV